MRIISAVLAVICPLSKLKQYGLIVDRLYIQITIAVSGKSFIYVNAIAFGGHGAAIAHPASSPIVIVLKKNHLKIGCSCDVLNL
jgi:hypothetical protein